MSSGTYRPDLHTREWARIRLLVLERDHWTCQLCGRQLVAGTKGAHVDHIVPHARGGVTELSNLRALCYYCNTSRGARQKRGYRLSLPHARKSRFDG